ncbi:MAG: hypothetical protein AB8G22_12555 [Saprospiraceae bacterium]
MKKSRKSIELLNQKLDKSQVVEYLKQQTLKGGDGNFCPPPWPPDDDC